MDALAADIRAAVNKTHETLSSHIADLQLSTETRLFAVETQAKNNTTEGVKVSTIQVAEDLSAAMKHIVFVEDELKDMGERWDADLKDTRAKVAAVARTVDLNVTQIVESLTRDINSLTKRLGDAERFSEQARAQTNASLSALQQSVSYKQESVSRAIQSLARQINVPNPLLTY